MFVSCRRFCPTAGAAGICSVKLWTTDLGGFYERAAPPQGGCRRPPPLCGSTFPLPGEKRKQCPACGPKWGSEGMGVWTKMWNRRIRHHIWNPASSFLQTSRDVIRPRASYRKQAAGRRKGHSHIHVPVKGIWPTSCYRFEKTRMFRVFKDWITQSFFFTQQISLLKLRWFIENTWRLM